MDTGESRSLAGGAVLRRARPGDEEAVGMDEWKIQRLSGDALTRLATS